MHALTYTFEGGPARHSMHNMSILDRTHPSKFCFQNRAPSRCLQVLFICFSDGICEATLSPRPSRARAGKIPTGAASLFVVIHRYEVECSQSAQVDRTTVFTHKCQGSAEACVGGLDSTRRWQLTVRGHRCRKAWCDVEGCQAGWLDQPQDGHPC